MKTTTASGLSVLGSEIKYEQLSYWRNARAAIFTFIFPIVFLCSFGLGSRNAKISLDGHLGVPFGLLIIPGIIAFSLTQACYTNLAIVLSIRRQTGQLMRRRATPVPPTMLIGGMIGSSLVITFILLGVVMVFGALVFHIGFPHHVLVLILGMALGAICFCSLGIAVQTFVKDADSAPPLINLPLMILAFMSGNFLNVASTGTVAKIASYFPLVHLNHIVRAGFSPGSGFGLKAVDVLNLVIWSAFAIRIGARRFKWAPAAQ